MREVLGFYNPKKVVYAFAILSAKEKLAEKKSIYISVQLMSKVKSEDVQINTSFFNNPIKYISERRIHKIYNNCIDKIIEDINGTDEWRKKCVFEALDIVKENNKYIPEVVIQAYLSNKQD